MWFQVVVIVLLIAILNLILFVFIRMGGLIAAINSLPVHNPPVSTKYVTYAPTNILDKIVEGQAKTSAEISSIKSLVGSLYHMQQSRPVWLDAPHFTPKPPPEPEKPTVDLLKDAGKAVGQGAYTTATRLVVQYLKEQDREKEGKNPRS